MENKSSFQDDLDDLEGTDLQKKTLSRLLRIVFKHKRPLLFGIVMVSFGTFAVLLEPRIFGYAIDEAIIPKRLDKLRQTGLILLLVTAVRSFSSIQQSFFFEMLGQRVAQELRIKLFTRLQSMPVNVYDKNPTGRLLTRVTNDIAALNEMFSAGFLTMFCNILTVAGILTWLIVLDAKLGLIAASVFPVLVLISAYFSKRLKIAYRESRGRLSTLNSFLAENLTGIRIIHLFNRQRKHLKRFDQLNNRYASAQCGSIRVFALFQPTITVAAGISIGLIIWFGGGATLEGNLKLGVLVTYFSLAMSLFQPVREIADKWNIFLSGMASAERIFEVLGWEREFSPEDLKRRAAPIPNLNGHIVFENVWFSYDPYPENKWILKNFNLEIRPGEKLAVVGHTGAGKTTIISLLLRFYEPQRGRILLDGIDIRSYDKRALRNSIGIVQQDVFLFMGSFQENVTFWNSQSMELVRKFFSQIGFRNKFDKSLQERGSNFSMGERQVIAFARAMSANPKIWILDEATANLDSETESLIQKAFHDATLGKTAILIAHRLATVKSADRIIVLHKGNLIECGNHEALMNENGLYARLYRYQSVSAASTPALDV